MLSTVLKRTHFIAVKALSVKQSIQGTSSTIRTFLTRCARSDGSIQPIRLFKPSGLSQNLSIRRQCTVKLDVNINVQNNVILYKYENARYFWNMHIFAIGQLFGWSILAVYTYSPSFWDIFTTDIQFQDYFVKNIIRLILCSFSILIGPMTYGLIYALCARTVKYIVLNKGGKKITLTTFHQRKSKSNINISIDMVKCLKHRTDKHIIIPVKLKNRRFYYMIDQKGIFLNPTLFDNTIGFA